MNYKLGWLGTAAFQAFTPEGRELVFDLAQAQALPPELKQGDEIDIELHPDHPANLATEMNSGYYEITHLKSGVRFKVAHKTSEWRFDKTFNCEPCNLTIEKSGGNYIYKKPEKAVPTKLSNFGVLRQAYETQVCPLCGFGLKES